MISVRPACEGNWAPDGGGMGVRALGPWKVAALGASGKAIAEFQLEVAVAPE